MSGEPSECGERRTLILLVGPDAIVWFLVISYLLTPHFLGHSRSWRR
jgi:hypothetical protein